MNTKNFKLSTLAKAMLPILAASALSACGDDDSSYTAPTPGTSVPGEVELAPNVDLPAAAATPSANEVSLSYIADTTSNVARMSNTTTDFSKWTLVCGDKSFTATSSELSSLRHF